jgi:soluble P-type ATPase
MLTITIPGSTTLRLEHLVLDFNGTMACDGVLLEGIPSLLNALSKHLRIHVLTGDTFARAAEALAGLPCTVKILESSDQAKAKLEFMQRLGASLTVCIGNGRNDRMMLGAAALGIGVVQTEGASVEALNAAKVVALCIHDALQLLLNPLRLAATLRD